MVSIQQSNDGHHDDDDDDDVSHKMVMTIVC